MNWLHRIGIQNPEDGVSEDEREAAPAQLERSAPGIAALLDGFSADGSHSILDLGSASESSLQLYAQYARRIRFADLLVDPPVTEDLNTRLPALGARNLPEYDLVLAWNILDWLRAEARKTLVERLVDLTMPLAKLYVLVDASGSSRGRPQQFSLLDHSRVLHRPVDPPRTKLPEILPAELERLLRPFRVVQAFTLRHGWREYVAVKKEGTSARRRGYPP